MKGFNMKKRTMLIDQDGVLANYPKSLLEIWRMQHPQKFWLPLSDARQHDTAMEYPEEYRGMLESITLRKGFFRGLSPIEGAKEALETLLDMGHDVRICTSPKRNYQNCVAEKFEWVEDHLGVAWTERIILTRDKTLVHGDMLIDDKPNVTGVCTPTWKHILYDQPYNRHLTQQPRLTWANWKEVILWGQDTRRSI